VLGLNESPVLGHIVVTRLRTFNGPALVERCHTAWRNKQPIQLEFRSPEGLQQQAPIVAARTIELEEGQVLLLWVRLPDEDISFELDYDEPGDEGNEDGDSLG